MASTNKCEYCGSTITSEDQTCPNCGASNPLYVVDLPRKVTDPKTIAELQEYCAERGMPLLRMRFFIGQDCKEAKAFGIYKESQDNFVVYKNKADGSRAERYRGPDEARAVKEISDTLIQECHSRGIYPDGKPARQTMADNYRSNTAGYGGSGKYSSDRGLFGSGKLTLGKLILIIIITAIIISLFGRFTSGSGLGSFFSGGTGSSYSTDYYSTNNNSNSSWNNDNNSSSWWYSDDDDDNSSSSWWNSNDNDSSSWWDSNDNSTSSWWDNDDDWDTDWGNDWDDWDDGGTDWDTDW